jgi:predicted 2-oxoglutarate/Fe(II)-dependent dioxygenase YbiX
MAAQYGFPASQYELHFRDLFFVKYEAKEGHQAGLDLHRDGSVLSFNMLLNKASDFEGGGTFFEAQNRTYSLEQGGCLMHSGKVMHAGAPVTQGIRIVLVGFVDARERVAVTSTLPA